MFGWSFIVWLFQVCSYNIWCLKSVPGVVNLKQIFLGKSSFGKDSEHDSQNKNERAIQASTERLQAFVSLHILALGSAWKLDFCCCFWGKWMSGDLPMRNLVEYNRIIAISSYEATSYTCLLLFVCLLKRFKCISKRLIFENCTGKGALGHGFGLLKMLGHHASLTSSAPQSTAWDKKRSSHRFPPQVRKTNKLQGDLKKKDQFIFDRLWLPFLSGASSDDRVSTMVVWRTTLENQALAREPWIEAGLPN